MINTQLKSKNNVTDSEYKNVRVAVAGATGYTGAELVKLIAGHPNAELAAVTSASYSA